MVLGLTTPSQADPGQLDVAFGAGGQRSMDLGGTYDWGYATAVQPDGRILAAGVTNARGTYDFAVSRHLPSGELDPSFGENGVAITDFGKSWDWAYALALQPDGRIVVAGFSDRSGSRDFALARYGSDGRLDGSFGRDGLVLTPVRPLSTDIVHGLAVQPDGEIVAAGVSFDEKATLRPHGDFMVVPVHAPGRTRPDLRCRRRGHHELRGRVLRRAPRRRPAARTGASPRRYQQHRRWVSAGSSAPTISPWPGTSPTA